VQPRGALEHLDAERANLERCERVTGRNPVARVPPATGQEHGAGEQRGGGAGERPRQAPLPHGEERFDPRETIFEQSNALRADEVDDGQDQDAAAE